MSSDERALSFQRTIDRLIRRLRRGDPPVPTRRRLLIVQIDGLSRAALDQGLRADLYAGFPDGRDVRRAARHPRLPLLRSGATIRYPLSAAGPRGAG